MYPVSFQTPKTSQFQINRNNSFQPTVNLVKNDEYAKYINEPTLLGVIIDKFTIGQYKKRIKDIVSGKINIYDEYKNDENFQKLTMTPYYSGGQGLQKLVDTISKLEIEKNEAAIHYKLVGDKTIALGLPPIPNPDTDISKCLKNTYAVLRDSRISPQTKNHVVENASDLYFQVNKLGNLSEEIKTKSPQQIQAKIMHKYWFL